MSDPTPLKSQPPMPPAPAPTRDGDPGNEKDWGDWTCPSHPKYQDWLYHRQKYRRIIQRDHAALVAEDKPRSAVGHCLAPLVFAMPLSVCRLVRRIVGDTVRRW